VAIQSNPKIQITNGTTTVTFADGAGGLTNYPLVRRSWAPAVAGIRNNVLGGRYYYGDVIEELTFNIRDTTAALCYDRAQTLAAILDTCDRYSMRGGRMNFPFSGASPFLLSVTPQGATLAGAATGGVNALILGRAGSDDLSGLALPNNTDDAGMFFEIRNCRIRIRRRGAWGVGSIVTASGAATANPGVVSIAIAASGSLFPALVDTINIAGFDKTATPTISAGFLCIADSTIQIVEAETGTGVAYTSVADAAANARGGSVLRYTPTGTAAAASGNITVSSLTTIPYAILAAVRNNSGTTTWQIQPGLRSTGAVVQGQTTYIDTSSANPRIVNLGTIIPPDTAATLNLTITASAAAGTLDIDYICIVPLQNELGGVIAHDAISLANSSAGAHIMSFIFHQDTINPIAAIDGTGSPISYRGNLPLFIAGSASISVAWLACGGTTANSWRFTNTTPAVVNITPTINRLNLTLLPI
jgi:hypothetical protein